MNTGHVRHFLAWCETFSEGGLHTKTMKRISMLLLLLAGLSGMIISCSSSSNGGKKVPPTVGEQKSNAPVGAKTLHPKVQEFYQAENPCSEPEWCGDLVKIDCGSIADGPLGYFDNRTGEAIMWCGGACMAPEPLSPKDCTACPPPEWKQCSAATPQ